MRITLHLDEEDLLRFRGALARAEALAASADPCDIIEGAKYALDHLPIASAPGYVRARIADVQRLIVMLEDEDWLLPPGFQLEVLRALAYFADPEDLVPDEIGVIGLLDDAIVLDILIRDLRGMLRAYASFVAFRAAWSTSENATATDERLARTQDLALCRKRLQTRLRPPSRRAANKSGSSIGKL
ncbi:MAG: YkvA family protein [Lysobacterales bacterium]